MTVDITINGYTFTAENNGGCFITDQKPVFPDDLSVVTVTSDDPVYGFVMRGAELIECASADGRYWFTFRELSPEERRQKELEDTIQMLTDCLLEMSELLYS